MLYKVTPAMPAPSSPLGPRDARAASAGEKAPRKRRKSAVFDADGNEVLITMMCLKCRAMKPLAMFGLRRMADGAIRNQPWCRVCRTGASKKKQPAEETGAEVASSIAEATPPSEPLSEPRASSPRVATGTAEA